MFGCWINPHVYIHLYTVNTLNANEFKSPFFTSRVKSCGSSVCSDLVPREGTLWILKSLSQENYNIVKVFSMAASSAQSTEALRKGEKGWSRSLFIFRGHKGPFEHHLTVLNNIALRYFKHTLTARSHSGSLWLRQCAQYSCQCCQNSNSFLEWKVELNVNLIIFGL